MKPLGHPAYGSIPHLPGSRRGPADHGVSPEQASILTKKVRDRHDLIIVQEKLDGSNCSVAKVDGKIVALGRAGYLAETSPFAQHKFFARWVAENVARFDILLAERERVSGEWLAQAHGTRYDLPHEPFVTFDLLVGQKRSLYHDFLLRVLPLGFTVPRLLHLGQAFSVAEAMMKIAVSGHGALEPVEGAVWRCEREGRVDFLAKYVREGKVDGCHLPEQNGSREAVWNWDVGGWEGA